jgi:hypothetical protein
MNWDIFTIVVATLAIFINIFVIVHRRLQDDTEMELAEKDYIRECMKSEIMAGYQGFRDRWSVETDHQYDALSYVINQVNSSNLSRKWMDSAKKVLAREEKGELTCLYCGTVSDGVVGSCQKCGAPKPRCIAGGENE